MTVHALRDQVSPELAKALAEFESKFTYPLGPGRSFRISHGQDYPRFFRSMGNATCFVAEQGGLVTGTLSVAIRALVMPNGQLQWVAYIGDLKVDPAARGSLIFLRLAQAAFAWARPQVSATYGVVMDGTRVSPTEYTGRVGIPQFLQIGKVLVLRFPTAMEVGDGLAIASAAQGQDQYRVLSRGRRITLGGNPAERSEIDPAWLIHREGLACGRLEDTRRAKRLIDSDGVEMRSAHLACFAWQTPQAGADLIHAARGHAAKLGMPALFVAVSQRDLAAIDPALGPIDKVIAPATIYGAGLLAGANWSINTSEI